MKTKGKKKEKVNIVTLGCAKNLVDSEVILTQLKGNDIDAVHESKKNDATTVIVNTCGFIENAKQESIDTILKFVDAKEEGHIEKLYVTGCLSHRYKDDLAKEIPNVDEYFGTTDLKAILAKFKADYKHELIGERETSTDEHYAYLKISEGCDRPCSFCAIPLMRGKHVSRPIEELVTEAKNLVKNGVKEILLIAQDSTYYGLDIYKKRNLSELLSKLSDIEGLDWIRLHYAFPTGFPEDILEIMVERKNICSYLDIPLQHGSSKILKLMRRGTDRQKTTTLLKKIREQVPGIAIRTTMIVGHPGETEEDFQELMDFVEESKFERLGVFAYSHEEDTHAGTMVDDVPEEVKNERVDALMELQEGISLEINEAKIGNTYKTLIDRKDGDYFVGRTEFDSPEVDNEVLVSAKDHYLRVGDFAEIKITSAEPFDLYGEPVI
ncbi:MAG: 30S ribosomal protein S12 methylthiotransferase RimO [Reichenbachiella sp.]|uniref:30S ribosomal protein S12 methylthiotransferase RimO n=1 Tax=Reichenbachiella sp. TaxID=2184521 RepID=UPI003263626D